MRIYTNTIKQFLTENMVVYMHNMPVIISILSNHSCQLRERLCRNWLHVGHNQLQPSGNKLDRARSRDANNQAGSY